MKMFSATPKLLEKILPYLDLVSNVSLVKARDVTQAILEKSLYWDKLVRRNCPSHHPRDNFYFDVEQQRLWIIL